MLCCADCRAEYKIQLTSSRSKDSSWITRRISSSASAEENRAQGFVHDFLHCRRDAADTAITAGVEETGVVHAAGVEETGVFGDAGAEETGVVDDAGV